MRSLTPAAAALGILGLLCAGAGLPASAGATAVTAPSNASEFAQQVLAEAVVPPGGVRTTAVETLGRRWETGAPDTPAVAGIVDLHELTLYDEPASSLIRYVRTHLGAGARVTGVGSATGLAQIVTVAVPVAGRHEYLAQVEYTAAPTNAAGDESELRVDALSVWVGTWPADERVPYAATVVVTGFETVTARTGGTSPVDVTLHPGADAAIIRAFDALGSAPAVMCEEDAATFELTFRAPATESGSALVARSGCAATLSVSRDGSALQPLAVAGCALLDAVATALPPRAVATRSAAAQCAPRGSEGR